eukprot:6185431-Pleurochrysis_carterae.AAC.3
MDKRLQVLRLWTVLAAFVRRRQGLERKGDQVHDELQGGGQTDTVQGRRANRSRVPERCAS